MVKEMLTHFSLFSGIGGIDLAAEWAGFESVGQCEFADYPTKALEKHWPNVPRWRDVRDVTVKSIREQGIGEITLLSGGFPCQPHSVAGKRQASADDRDLWGEFARVICEVRPKWVLGENVPGLLSSEDGRFFGRVLDDLAQMGYNVGWCVYGAAHVGARHRRERIFIIAHSNSDGCNPCDQREGGGKRTALNTVITSGDFRGINDTGPNSNAGQNERNGNVEQSRERNVPNTDNTGNRTHQCSDNSKRQTSDKGRQKFSQCRIGGPCENVADTKCPGLERYDEHRAGLNRENEGLQFRPKSGGREIDVSYTDSPRLQIPRQESRINTIFEKIGTQFRDWWSVEPNVGRVANGIPKRVDRLKCLGNAVVPQQVYPILQAIADIERSQEETR